jgi:hypothetical protein
MFGGKNKHIKTVLPQDKLFTQIYFFHNKNCRLMKTKRETKKWVDHGDN